MEKEFNTFEGENYKASRLIVSILMEDIKEAQKLAQILRKIGVLANYIDTSKQLWDSLFEFIPSLVILDEKKAFLGDKNILTHPMVEERKVLLAFFIDEKIRHLGKAENLFHMGIIKKNTSYAYSLKNILERVNKIRELEYYLETLEEKSNFLEAENNELRKNIVSGQKNEENEKGIVDDIKTWPSTDNFEKLLAIQFNKYEWVKEYSIFALSLDRLRVNSPFYKFNKYRRGAVFNTKEKAVGGIQLKMKHQILLWCENELGKNTILLDIMGESEFPDLLVAINVDLDSLSHFRNFNWNHVSLALSSFYKSHLLSKLKITEEKKKIVYEPESFINLLDEDNEETQRCYLIQMSFREMFSSFPSDQNKFHFRHFYRDFQSSMAINFIPAIKAVTLSSFFSVSLLVDKEKFDKKSMGRFLNDFNYYRYFDKEDELFYKSLKVKVKVLKPSLKAYLEWFNEEVARGNSNLRKSEDRPLQTV